MKRVVIRHLRHAMTDDPFCDAESSRCSIDLSEDVLDDCHQQVIAIYVRAENWGAPTATCDEVDELPRQNPDAPLQPAEQRVVLCQIGESQFDTRA
jgi:hypothetical protein